AVRRVRRQARLARRQRGARQRRVAGRVPELPPARPRLHRAGARRQPAARRREGDHVAAPRRAGPDAGGRPQLVNPADRRADRVHEAVLEGRLVVVANVEGVAPYRADWRRGKVTSWLTTVDHKRIGILYLWTTLLFFAAGGILALLIRTQLATPNESVLTKNSYNEVVTMHGTTMIFLVLVPIAAAFGNFLVPLMIGARDMAFPRLNALSYWLFVLGGVVLYLSFFAKDGAARSGWTSYVPLTTLHSPGDGQDLWILSLHILSISSFVGAINFIVTIHNMRTPGMSWMRLPLFCWGILTYAWMLVAVLPTLSAGLTLMLLDRRAGTHFFDPAHGGSPILFQHLFWFFGHPEVYIM